MRWGEWDASSDPTVYSLESRAISESTVKSAICNDSESMGFTAIDVAGV
jgi:hypothetical protein